MGYSVLSGKKQRSQEKQEKLRSIVQESIQKMKERVLLVYRVPQRYNKHQGLVYHDKQEGPCDGHKLLSLFENQIGQDRDQD